METLKKHYLRTEMQRKQTVRVGRKALHRMRLCDKRGIERE